MGDGYEFATGQCLSDSCQSPRRFCANVTAERVKIVQNLEYFGKFLAETLENEDYGGFSERIFGNFPGNPVPPAGKLHIRGYGERITNGRNTHSQKTGLKSGGTLASP